MLGSNVERRLKPLQAIELIGPDVGQEPAAIVLARGAERALIVAETGCDMQRRGEERRLATPFGFDAHLGLRVAPISAIAKIVEQAIEVQIEAGAGADLDER